MGLILHKNCDLNAAIKSHQKVVSIKPDFFEADNNVGNVSKTTTTWTLRYRPIKRH